MSSPFNGKQIIEAYYTNEAHDTIQIIYNDNEDLTAEPSYVTVYIPATDPNNYDLKNLFNEGYDFDRIQKETLSRNQEQANVWRQLVRLESQQQIQLANKEFEKRYEEQLAQAPVNPSNILQTILDNNSNEELLFKVKLLCFELPDVKAGVSKEVKQNIRTAKSLIQLFAVLNEVL